MYRNKDSRFDTAGKLGELNAPWRLCPDVEVCRIMYEVEPGNRSSDRVQVNTDFEVVASLEENNVKGFYHQIYGDEGVELKGNKCLNRTKKS